MADPIRPGFNPNPQANLRPGGGGAAQRAFFAAAMGQASAPAAPQAAAQTTVTRAAPMAQSPQRIPTSLPAEPPTRILRPGSLLDIKV